MGSLGSDFFSSTSSELQHTRPLALRAESSYDP